MTMKVTLNCRCDSGSPTHSEYKSFEYKPFFFINFRSAEVLDSLRNFFPKKIMNTVSHVISLSDVMIKAVHHIATLHQESSRRVWNITQKYSSIVRPILGMSPTVYKTVVESFSHLDLIEVRLDFNSDY